MEWSPQQDAALKSVSNWLKDKRGPQVFRLFGWAGTGKSTLAVHLAQDAGKVCYAAFTGKAALVMRKRGCAGATTIHSLIYMLVNEEGGEPKFVLNWDSSIKDAHLVVIDEVSMVGKELGEDLLRFGAKVLVLGDPFQLPPVHDAGFFTDVEPDVMLTEIHRQAADNPIIRMSMDIREGGGLSYGTYGESRVISRRHVDQADVLGADQVLVGRNKTRHDYNTRIRELRGYTGLAPNVSERVICLRNNHQKNLLNGQTWIAKKAEQRKLGKISLLLDPDDDDGRVADVKVTTHERFFNGTEDQMTWAERRTLDEFTYGHAITVHKAQGSQWNNVYLFDESFVFREDQRRHQYTGITRAAERITVAV